MIMNDNIHTLFTQLIKTTLDGIDWLYTRLNHNTQLSNLLVLKIMIFTNSDYYEFFTPIFSSLRSQFQSDDQHNRKIKYEIIFPGDQQTLQMTPLKSTNANLH